MLKLLGIAFTMAIGLPLIFFLLVINGFWGSIPDNEAISNIENMEASVVYDHLGEVLGRFYLQDRTEVSLDEISPFLIKALVATEDRRFYVHSGIDARSLLRVLVKSILLQQEAGGGSTITLQLAKNLYPRKNFRFLYYPINKTKEAIIAYRIEQQYSKDEILTLYLNTISFGQDVFGVESASHRYFNKSAANLAPQEAAALVGMLKATTSYNPVLHPVAAKQRRNIVLGLMKEQGIISSDEFDNLSTLPLATDYRIDRNDFSAYFLQQVRKKVINFLDTSTESGEDINLLTDGLRIYTTLDKGMQEYAEDALIKNMAVLQKRFEKHWYDYSLWSKHQELLNREIKKIANGRSPKELQVAKTMPIFSYTDEEYQDMSPIDSLKHYLQQLQAGFVALDPKNGAVRSWVGGIDFQFFPYDHVQEKAKRQVGSTFKPIVYAAALEKGISPCNYYNAEQETYEVEEGEWKPANDNALYEGKYTMEGALEGSINTVSVKILQDAGINRTIELAHAMGISSNIPAVLSIALGTPSISPLEMATAYCSFINGGYRVSPFTIERIEDQDGNVLYEHQSKKPQRVIKEKTSKLMTYLLEGVVENGTAKSMRTMYGLTNSMGGKTGTTQNNADGWFIAVTPKLVTSTWVGGIYPEISFEDTRLGQGATMALPICAGFYRRLTKDSKYNDISAASFKPIPDEWRRELDCDPFKENFNLFNFLFGKDKKADKKEVDTTATDDQGIFQKIKGIFKKKKSPKN